MAYLLGGSCLLPRLRALLRAMGSKSLTTSSGAAGASAKVVDSTWCAASVEAWRRNSGCRAEAAGWASLHRAVAVRKGSSRRAMVSGVVLADVGRRAGGGRCAPAVFTSMSTFRAWRRSATRGRQGSAAAPARGGPGPPMKAPPRRSTQLARVQHVVAADGTRCAGRCLAPADSSSASCALSGQHAVAWSSPAVAILPRALGIPPHSLAAVLRLVCTFPRPLKPAAYPAANQTTARDTSYTATACALATAKLVALCMAFEHPHPTPCSAFSAVARSTAPRSAGPKKPPATKYAAPLPLRLLPCSVPPAMRPPRTGSTVLADSPPASRRCITSSPLRCEPP